MKNSLLILIFILLSGSTQTKIPDDLIVSIDIYKAFNTRKIVNLSSVVKSVEYIPLETRSDIVLSPSHYYEVTNDYIIVRNTNLNLSQILVFDRISGNYIKEIAKSGRGPNEYRYPVPDFFNIYNKAIYTYGNNRNIISYDLDGNHLESFKLQEWNDDNLKGGKRLATFDAYLNNDVFVSYIPNSKGLEKRKLVLFSRERIIKEYPNYLFWERKTLTSSGILGSGRYFFRSENSLYFKETFNDTVFHVTQEKLVPVFVFSAGNLTFPSMLREDFLVSGKYKKCLIIDGIIGNKNYLFFSLIYEENSFCSFYDKGKKRTIVCDKTNTSHSGLIDDINGFLPLVPKKITQNNEMICVLEAVRIKEWIDANPLKAKSLWGKFPWLKNITEMDNPVIVIGKM